MLQKCAFGCFVTALMAAGSIVPVYAASTVPLPNSMAAAGDSITRAFDATGACFLRDCLPESWSTGTDPSVDSQYTRLLALNPAIAANEHNDAKSGAKMADLAGQLTLAGQNKNDYVTVLMGGNDLCTSSAATMTPTTTFVTQYYTALADYFHYNPGGHVFVSSIPNLLQLWTTLHTNSSATFTWSLFKICQSMLAAGNTDADRQKVVAQENLDNYVMGYVCKTYFANCRWDNLATYNVVFSASEVSKIDYFHPNISGQAALAATTWKATYWGP
jgi:lysophospholipase L1-like esterase